MAPESNSGAAAITKLKQTYENIFVVEQFSGTQVLERKNRKPTPRPSRICSWTLRKADEDGMLELSDTDLIGELRAYTHDDVMDRDEDVRLTTLHFDLLIAWAIAW